MPIMDVSKRYNYRTVNGELTAGDAWALRSGYRAMKLADILKRIQRRLEARGLSEAAAGHQAGRPDAIRNIRRKVESGQRGSVRADTLEALAEVLHTSPEWLISGTGPEEIRNNTDGQMDYAFRPNESLPRRAERTPQMRGTHLDSPPIGGDPNHRAPSYKAQQRQLMPVYGAAEGGSGALILTKDPVERREIPHYLANVTDVYGVFVREESMSPRYEPGEVAEVAPHHPYRRGDDVLLYRENGDGDERVMLKRLVGWTDAEWTVEQFNPPKTFTLSRAEWTKCHVVRGRGPRS